MVKVILIFCATALFVQSVFSQCGRIGYGALSHGAPFACNGFGYAGYPGIGYGGTGCGYGSFRFGPRDIGAGFGGGFFVTSSSPIAPIGLFVTSDNAIDGALAVQGNLPFLGAVATEGAFPTAGAGAVSYACGNGDVRISAEAPVTAVVAPAIAPAVAPAIAPAVAPAVAPVGTGALGYGGYSAIGAYGGCGCGIY